MKKNVKQGKGEVKNSRSNVIASRKTCSVNGTGLSHYILVDKKAR